MRHARHSSESTRHRAVVLIVDDEPIALAALGTALHKSPYEVLTASSPAAAMAVLESSADAGGVDVVIADEHMPGARGSELLAEIRNRFPGTIRILLTGSVTADAATRAVNEAEVLRLLQKPASADLLREVIEAALQRKAREDATDRILAVARAELDDPVSRPASDAPAAPSSVDWSRLPTGPLQRLTPREREVAELIALGRRVASVAEALYLSEHTVRNHLKSVFRKLEVHSQSELIDRLCPRRGRSGAN